MSDWLARELSEGLAPTAAPAALKVRLGLAPSTRREFPRLGVALAAAVVLAIGGGYAGGRNAVLGLREAVAGELRVPRTPRFVSKDPVVVAAWLRREADVDVPRRCEGATGRRVPLAGNATVLLAHAAPSAEIRPAVFRLPEHATAAAPEGGCQLCHSL